MPVYEVDGYSARAFILKLEKDSNLTIRIRDSEKYCMICIDKEAKQDDTELSFSGKDQSDED